MTALVTEPSICIPRTLNNVTWQQVKSTFEQLLGRGTVERVDIVPSKANDPQPFCRIFVHFRYWPNTEDATAIRDRLVSGEVIKVVYDNPWFWRSLLARCQSWPGESPEATVHWMYRRRPGILLLKRVSNVLPQWNRKSLPTCSTSAAFGRRVSRG